MHYLVATKAKLTVVKVPYVWIVKIRRPIGHDEKNILVLLRKNAYEKIKA